MAVIALRGPVLTSPDQEQSAAWVVEGRITYERPSTVDVRLDGWVIPGLVDAHNHVGMGSDGPVDQASALDQAQLDIAAGTLLIRDAGSPLDTRWLDDRDDVPAMIRAGRHIARTRRYLRSIGDEVEPEQLADAVRVQAARGDGWVKLVGDWIDRELGDLAPCWPRDALTEAIAVAHEAGARVTAHCFGPDCLDDLIDAGIDCIEHGTGFTSTTLSKAARRGVALVPTLINIETFPQIAASGELRFPAYADRMRRLHAARYDTIGAAYEAGLPVFVGTDAGGTIAHGRVADEIAELIRAGLSNTAALNAACWAAREWLGRPGLGEGDPADVVVLAEDPRRHPDTLRHPVAVLRNGRLHGTPSSIGVGA